MAQDFDVNSKDVSSAIAVAKKLTSERELSGDTIFDTPEVRDLFNQVLAMSDEEIVEFLKHPKFRTPDGI